MSDVELLRRAAAKVREQAEACTALSSEHEEPWYRTGQPHVMTTTWVRFEEAAPEDAELIAAMGPAVALAVADWLDALLDSYDSLGPDCEISANPQALALAHALLRESD